MFDLVLGLRQAIEAEIAGSQLLFRSFWVLGLCNGYGNVGPWVYPCLGLFCMYKYMLRRCSEYEWLSALWLDASDGCSPIYVIDSAKC
jgi:hypothetical protein